MKRRVIRDLFHRGNRCIDVPSAQREGVYFGFQGEINLVLPDFSSYKVFIPYFHALRTAFQDYQAPKQALYCCEKPAVSPFPSSSKDRTRARRLNSKVSDDARVYYLPAVCQRYFGLP